MFSTSYRPLRGRTASIGGSAFRLPGTPGTKIGELSSLTLSRAFKPKPTPLPTDAISITAGGQYQLKVSGVWQPLTAVSGTWGTATAVRVARTSSDFYATPETAVLTIGLVDYTFTVTTIADPATFGWIDKQYFSDGAYFEN